MNKMTKKLTAIGLCAALCLSGVGMAFAQTSQTREQPAEEKADASTQANASAREVVKDETVYVLTDAGGAVEKIIVSDWLQNTAGLEAISDVSSLADPENSKGDEGYTADGKDGLIWDCHGEDLYYQGETGQELPVSMTVSYQLDDKPIEARELAGKSGRVTIRFDYENRQYEMVEIDGKQEQIYVPFAMVTGLVLDSDTFRNVELTNGKLLNDGDHMVVLGLAFPGLQENLGLNREQLELPDYVEITADVTDFELGVTVTVATNQLFRALDETSLDSADSLTDALVAMTDAMEQLTDGSSELYEGLNTLLEQTGTLHSGVEQLASGAAAVQSGADSLSGGAAQLQSGSAQLATGLEALSANSAALNGGAAQVFDTLLAAATAQLHSAGVSVPALTAENYATVLDGVLTSLGDSGSAAAQTVAALKASLDSYSSFYQGLLTYTAGVDSAAAGAASLSSGAQTLNAGMTQLRSGAASLASGAQTMQGNMPELAHGVTQLRDGAGTLSDGLRQFREEITDRLTALLGSDPETTTTRLKATADVSAAYRTFTGIHKDMDGQVKFIYRTDEIKLD